MTELEKAPTVGAFSEIAVRSTTAFFDVLEATAAKVVICEGCEQRPGTLRVWKSAKGDRGRYFCDECEEALAAARNYLVGGDLDQAERRLKGLPA